MVFSGWAQDAAAAKLCDLVQNARCNVDALLGPEQDLKLLSLPTLGPFWDMHRNKVGLCAISQHFGGLRFRPCT